MDNCDWDNVNTHVNIPYVNKPTDSVRRMASTRSSNYESSLWCKLHQNTSCDTSINFTSPDHPMKKKLASLKPLRMLHPGTIRWDAAVLLLLLLATYYLEHLTPHIRSIDLDDVSLKHPHLPDIVPSVTLLLSSHLLPLIILFLLHLRQIRFILPLLTIFTLTLFESTIITVFLTNILKLLVGRPRPHFSTVCVSYAPHVENLCTGDVADVREARKSFPSGHSSLSFSAAVVLTAFLAMKLRLSDPRVNAKTPRLLIILSPVFAAATVAASRTIDYHHHYADVVAGSLLGIGIAAAVMCNRWCMLEKAVEDINEGYEPVEESEV